MSHGVFELCKQREQRKGGKEETEEEQSICRRYTKKSEISKVLSVELSVVHFIHCIRTRRVSKIKTLSQDSNLISDLFIYFY